ncbi:MAG: DUF523 and DUF1722 domain-containing protein [Candidatus Neomarinimicrobiota bacterium]
MYFPKPNIVVSSCLELAACRYNGQMIRDEIVRSIQPFVNFIPICPEVEIGLGIPREPVRLVRSLAGFNMIQPASGRDLTVEMQAFSQRFLGQLKNVDGFILKSRSPSCGIRDTKLYPRVEKSPMLGKGAGLFAAAVVQSFPYLPCEDEGRLTNAALREHYLTAVFTLARFRNNCTFAGNQQGLVDFQADHKLLFMTYNQTVMRQLGRIVANQAKQPFLKVLNEYTLLLPKIFRKLPRSVAHINTQMHAFGYFSKQLTGAEKAYFLELLQKYRQGIITATVVNHLIKSWIVRFGQPYLERQQYFEPFPEGLTTLPDSGKK